MISKSVKVIFDTNVWISFLIGKRLSSIRKYISDSSIKIVTTEQLIEEIKIVTGRDKLKKYFSVSGISELINLLETIAENVDIMPINFVCKDPKDNFLFDLIEFSKADYLVTGDKDLLEHRLFKNAQIISPTQFETELEKLKQFI